MSAEQNEVPTIRGNTINVIYFTDFSKHYSPDITKVTSIAFSTKGWDQILDPTSIIYIDKNMNNSI